MSESEPTGCETATTAALLEELHRRSSSAVLYVNLKCVEPGTPNFLTIVHGDVFHLCGAMQQLINPSIEGQLQKMRQSQLVR